MIEQIEQQIDELNRQFAMKPKRPKLIGETPAELRAHADAMESYANQCKVVEDGNAKLKARIDSLTDAWTDSLYGEYPELNAKQKDLIYSKAWEDGHSAGLHEVAIHFRELCDLFRSVMETKR